MSRCPDVSALMPPVDGATWTHVQHCAACRSLARIGAGHGGDGAGPMTAACCEVEPMIALVPEIDLEAGDRERVERHLAECARCTAVVAALCLDLDRPGVPATPAQPQQASRMPEVTTLITDAMPAPFRGAVEVTERTRRGRSRAAWVVIAAACVAAAVIVLLQHRRGHERAAESTRATARRRRHARAASHAGGAGPGRRHADAAGSATDLPDRLSRADVLRGIASVRDKVQRCRSDKRPGSGDVIVKVKFWIAPSGRVTRAVPHPDSKLGRCVARAVETARFPRARQGMIVDYPFVFRGDSPPADHRGAPPRGARR